MSLTRAYLYLLVICFAMDSFVNHHKQCELKDRKMFSSFHIIFVIYLGLMIGLRDITVGPDTRGYVDGFYGYANRTFASIFDSSHIAKEYLFYSIAKIIRTFTDNRFVYTCFFGLFFSFSFGKLVQKYSKNYLISYIVLLTLNMAFIISGMRQVAAMSICMLSVPLIQKRKLIPFLLCVFIAYYFHNTSIIFLLAYPLATVKFNKWHIIIVLVSVMLAYVFPGLVHSILFNVINWDRIESYENYDDMLTSSGLIIKGCILLFNIYCYKPTVKKNSSNIFFFNMSVLGVVFQAFTAVISQFFRISMYFSIFDTILIANAEQPVKEGSMKQEHYSKNVIQILLITVMIVYYSLVTGSIKYRMGI